MKQFIANRHTTPGTPALEQVPTEKIPIYDTKADAEADLANLAEGQIVGTKDASNDYEAELYNYVDAKLATTTTEIAMDVFKTGSKAQLYKLGNNVQFRYLVWDSSTFNPITEATWVSIGTIPEGYRPKSDIQFLFQGSTANADGGVAGMVRIKTDGRVLIYKNTGMNIGYEFSIQCDYNVDSTNNNFMSVNTLKDAKDYTDEKAVRKYDYTMTGTTSIVGDIQVLCNNLVTLGDNTYSGEFFFFFQTSGHYSISIRHSSNTFVNGIVTLGQDVNTASTWTVHMLNGTYHIRENVINKNLVVATPATTKTSMFDALRYHLINADWTFLTNQPTGTTATGNFELAGYYWGTYTATHHGNNNVTVTGTIDWGALPHTFSAFHDASGPVWKMTIDGQCFTSIDGGFVFTRKINDGLQVWNVTGQGTYQAFIAAMRNNGLLARPSRGEALVIPDANLTVNNKYLLNLDPPYTSAWAAGSGWWVQNPEFYNVDTSASTLWLEWTNTVTISNTNLWGINWGNTTIQANLEIIV